MREVKVVCDAQHHPGSQDELYAQECGNCLALRNDKPGPVDAVLYPGTEQALAIELGLAWYDCQRTLAQDDHFAARHRYNEACNALADYHKAKREQEGS